ncbi:DUF1697 domain-containing protein [Dehalogenimonas etheniformans]|uniref:DUF1697 domain-containing protein n=1 Tax=Dehalogenimonas etheniformans TaxID=1536648 RepID=A0A2P5P6W7_9CHLR|nr:DUF1697 domain-containing protein [Dehalogenimonas etheniformans]PPD58037.1 DUF1697 domain-containing protein [Dehalogenimonas etheniformans]QNT75387.1 DUF1697 domain-containing protein [Dehalogenimonas etheniformans]
MEYVALFRGLNAGGKSTVKMAELTKAVSELGYEKARSYLPSGNIIFETDEGSKTVTRTLEDLVLEHFKIETKIVVKSCHQLTRIVAEMPGEWENRKDLRRRVVFIREPVTPDDVLREVETREGIDFIEAGSGVLYMSTLMTALTRSWFTRLITKPIYKELTIRDYGTVLRILELMACR